MTLSHQGEDVNLTVWKHTQVVPNFRRVSWVDGIRHTYYTIGITYQCRFS